LPDAETRQSSAVKIPKLKQKRMKAKCIAARLGAATLTVILVASFTGCRRTETKSALPSADFERQGNLVIVPQTSSLRSRLTFETARSDEIQRELAAPAVVEADPQKFARIFPPLSGRLLKLHVQLGDTVNEGQLLASLNSPDFHAAQGDYIKARSAVQLTSRALKRQQELLENKIAAQKDVEQATSDYDSAKSDLDSATGRLLAFGFNPETNKLSQSLEVFSPVAGRVVDMASAHGEFHNDPTVPLMTVADLSTVWLTASIQEKDLRFLTNGQNINASFTAYPGEVFTGKVLFIGDLIDPDIRTAKVRIAFANADNRLKPGMFATVKFLGFPETQITVPTAALVQVGQSAFVFDQVKPWMLQPREVTVGPQQGERTVISKGLESGASILAREGVLFQ
jgi:membrane fusion protein, heavy metal efflux system